MIKRILIFTGIAVLLGLIVLWVITGGPAAAWRAARGLINPIGSAVGGASGSFLKLPWQISDPSRGPDISGYVGDADRLLGGEDQNGTQGGQDVLEFGNPSPYAGSVGLSKGGASQSSAGNEYVELTSSFALQSPIVISGWSVQSAVTGVRVYIPEAAPAFIMGIVNQVGPVALNAGDSAIVTTGVSPVGVSFQENSCSGYLRQLRQFEPDLRDECPAPSDALPQTADTLRTYGASCFDYIAGLSRCYFPGTQTPSTLSSACRSFVANTFSYNGCVNIYRGKASFALPSWRLFLNRSTELWNDSHDIIRLLDMQGRTVDVLSY